MTTTPFEYTQSFIKRTKEAFPHWGELHDALDGGKKRQVRLCLEQVSRLSLNPYVTMEEILTDDLGTIKIALKNWANAQILQNEHNRILSS